VQEKGFIDGLYEHGDELETYFLSVGQHFIPSFTHPKHPLSLLQDPAAEMTL
jgi:hypothetical protein